jgi:Flp pilus assembly protein TadD
VAALALAAALAAAPAARAQGLGLQDVSTPGTQATPALGQQVAVPEPVRPALTTPYDGAFAAWRAGRADEALRLAEDGLKTDPRDPRLRFLRGVILSERGRADDAIAVFRAMTEDFPELPEPYNNLAVLQAQRGDWDSARAALEQSIRAVPGYALAHENLGDIHLQLAARAYEQAGRLDPRSASARDKLAMARELIVRVQARTPATPPSASSNPRPGAPPQVTPR